MLRNRLIRELHRLSQLIVKPSLLASLNGHLDGLALWPNRLIQPDAPLAGNLELTSRSSVPTWTLRVSSG
jgi:hypothetical protein